ncbi:MAG: DUF429 domain-containing protein [Nanoarchaeota archaeon]
MESTIHFVGVDLAWSVRNATGIAVIEAVEKDGRILSARLVHALTAESDEEILKEILLNTSDHVHVAIDAPLVVPNENGRRRADHVISQLFRTYHAGAYPANRTRLSQWSGYVRGERLGTLLEQEGFCQQTHPGKTRMRKTFFEVYPHPSMVVLFGLDKVLRYKAKPKHDYATRWEAFRKYQQHLRSLEQAYPPLHLSAEIIERDLTGLRGKALKHQEDMLDAIFCAYVAEFSFAKPEECAVIGTLQDGYITTPVFRHMRDEIAKNQI